MSVTAPERDATSVKKNRFDRIADKFKLNAHFEMERFRIVITIITVLGILIITATAVSAYRANKVNISGVAQYTNEFLTSRTQQTGTVTGVYTNSTNTRSVVLFGFTEDATMSQNADDYEVLIMGVNNGKPEKAHTAMTGNLVSFGNTGQMGLVLDAPQGFDMQVLNATVTAKKELVLPKPMAEEDRIAYGYGGDDFVTQDKWRMVFNPAATGAITVPELDAQDFDVRGFLSQTVFLSREQEARKAADKALVEMHTQQGRIGSYLQALSELKADTPDDVGVTLLPPAPPVEIAGDEVTGLSNEELTVALKNDPAKAEEALKDKSDLARRVDTYDDGFMPSTYKLNTKTVVAGGTNYDWRDRTIAEGYAKRIVPAGYTVEGYLDELKKMRSNAQAPSYARDFVLSNGRNLSDYTLDSGSLMSMNQVASNVVGSYRSFYDAKVQYQSVALVNLLMLEQELDTAVGGSKLASNDVVTIRR